MSIAGDLSGFREKFPVVVFSHGLGGMRSTYSYLCSGLAANGYIVFAIEHRDGSSCCAYSPNGNTRFSRPTDGAPEKLLEFRQVQNRIRCEEVKACVELLKTINDGLSSGVIVDGDVEYNEAVVESFKGRLNLDNMFLAGHSFGVRSLCTLLML